MVELTGLTSPATFLRLPDALAALWRAMRVLPLTAFQADCYRYFLTRPDAAERVREFLERDGHLTLTFSLLDGSHTLRMSSVESVHAVAGYWCATPRPVVRRTDPASPCCLAGTRVRRMLHTAACCVPSAS
jgi:hypothetical protein